MFCCFAIPALVLLSCLRQILVLLLRPTHSLSKHWGSWWWWCWWWWWWWYVGWRECWWDKSFLGIPSKTQTYLRNCHPRKQGSEVKAKGLRDVGGLENLKYDKIQISAKSKRKWELCNFCCCVKTSAPSRADRQAVLALYNFLLEVQIRKWILQTIYPFSSNPTGTAQQAAVLP